MALPLLALAGCGTQRVGAAGGELPVLRIGSGAAAAALGWGGTPKLSAALPDGPAAAAVHRFTGEVTQEEVAVLATALGLNGPVQSHAYGWSVGRRGDAQLAVRSDGTGAWTYVDGADRCAPLLDVDASQGSDAVTSSCAQEPDQRDPAPDARRARAAAAPVLAAVGLGDAPGARVQDYGDLAWVSVDPTVGGLPTTGVETTVAVAGAGIASASGHLRSTTEGEQYPLISARTAWQQLGELPVPDIAIACPAPDSEPKPPPCSTTPPPITRVELGLVPRTEPDGALLVPAWLFTSRAGTSALVAVAPEYLADPGTGSGQGDSTPGQVEPGSPPAGAPRSHGPVVDEPPNSGGVAPAQPVVPARSEGAGSATGSVS